LRKTLFLLILLLVQLTVNCSSQADLRPLFQLTYEGSGIVITFQTLEPDQYFQKPLVRALLNVNGSHFTFFIELTSGRIVNGNAPWSTIPFFTRKWLKIGEKVLYDEGWWSVKNITKYSFKGAKVKAVVLTLNNLTRIYDWAAGVMFEGDIVYQGRTYRVKLVETNLEWIYIKYSRLYIDWYNLTVFLRDLNGSSLFRLHSIGKSVLGRDIWALEYGPQNATKIFLITAGIHGPEVIGIKTVLYVLNNLDERSSIKNLLFNKGFKLVFILPLNPDGLEAGKVAPPYLWYRAYVRKNARYVDLNRNFDADWGIRGSSGDVRNPYYRGPYPASEPETRALQSFINNHNVIYHVDLHSGDVSVIIPSSSGLEKDYEEQAIGYYASQLFKVSLLHGTSTGLAYYYTYKRKSKAVSMIIELYLKGSTDRWFERYNPLDERRVMELGEKLLDFIEGVLKGSHLESIESSRREAYTIFLILVAVILVVIIYARKTKARTSS